MAKISVIYHHFPHYRAAVMRALMRSNRHEYSFYGDLCDYNGIKSFKGDNVVQIKHLQFKHSEDGKIDIIGYDEAVSKEYDATIIIGNPNMPGTWKAQKLAKKNGLATAYWAHGWLKKENFVKSKIRNYYFNRADKVLVYGERAKNIASSTGFDTAKIKVIWNSLDFNTQNTLFNKYKSISRCVLREKIGMSTKKPIILTISRITDVCHYDWLIEALAYIKKSYRQSFDLWMIGDGPAFNSLKQLANNLNVSLYGLGSMYDEDLIAQHIMASDMVVSPGKIGLTAMHALAYGTPVVTHGNFDLQMPEVEAVVDGTSGVFFKYGDHVDLANKIINFFENISDYNEKRKHCRESLIGRFTPDDQARLIDEAMDDILNVKA